MRRIGKFVGIDSYSPDPLAGCVADVNGLARLLENNDDKSSNFNCETLINNAVTRIGLRQAVEHVFNNPDVEIALFFFAGHGVRRGEQEPYEGILRTIDGVKGDEGVPMEWVLAQANQSKARERLIILDCCHAGAIDQVLASRTPVPLREGVSILAASRTNQAAAESGGRGVFSLLVGAALDGGAADVRGFVTAASIYAYVDQLLTPWKQRPIFRASVAGMAPIRRAKHAVSDEMLREIGRLFSAEDTYYRLDKSYEPSEQPRHAEHERIFGVLQHCRAAGLVEPVGFPHMYDAAMGGTGCKLTPLGRGYWHQVKNRLF
jgi:hypothetical protein